MFQDPQLFPSVEGEEGGPAEGWRGSVSASRCWLAAQRPLLESSLLSHLAGQRQWWLILQPSLLPTGGASRPRVSEASPENRSSWEAARGQLKGTSQGTSKPSKSECGGSGKRCGPGALQEWGSMVWVCGKRATADLHNSLKPGLLSRKPPR